MKSRTSHWVSVAAIGFNFREPTRKAYSSVSLKLDISAFSEMMLNYRGDGVDTLLDGTSGAAPFATGMFAMCYQCYYQKFGYCPSPKEPIHLHRITLSFWRDEIIRAIAEKIGWR